ncbi:Sucrase/ferredoxin-like-domain-containing protein [Stachybotrys elegans]|uniref:Altered inheritance of mitochondria protein 32 n=1 Tax=Stachybotrys elegans TaxID=80388 RepID=A0A8K0WSB9_9HYPO|nr:Sucrase/ferredoxin-like-domain-containing protein [Stachybotrys elegans]
MLPSRSLLRPLRLSQSLRRQCRETTSILGSRPSNVLATRSFASKPAPLPAVPTCPSPTCPCAATPVMPEGLEIDHKTALNGAITGYAEHVLVCTGHSDWPSKIEEENSGDNLAADLKELFGRGGDLSDPFHNVSVLNSSFPSTPPPRAEVQSSSVYLLPSFKYVPVLPRVSFAAVEALAKGYLLPKKLHSAHDVLPPIHRDRLTRQEVYQQALPGVQDVRDVLVLICGHGGRDMRCGVMAPVLKTEFEEKMAAQGMEIATGPRPLFTGERAAIEGDVEGKTAARVGLISHIGGHKYAGNVIVYIPPTMKLGEEPHPLAGHGIWYGRVEPRHVEGIVKETIGKGNIIADMFRGAINGDRQILRSSARCSPPALRYSTSSTRRAPAPLQSKALPTFVLAVCLLGVAGFYLAQPSSPQKTLNTKTFIPYTITARDAISPTSFVFTVSPEHPDAQPPYLLPESGTWRWPLWSVEFKQPEVQIARHYTPLPPREAAGAADGGALRFYVRAVGDGEMSNYLSRLGVGRQVWLRGPHPGFDILKRLGVRREVVFLAGGTGVVPGIQAANAVLAANEDAKVTLLWAVRKREEMQSAKPPPPSRSWWASPAPTELQADVQQPSPVAQQLCELKEKYADRLSVYVAVSEEGVRFDEKAISKALVGSSPRTKPDAASSSFTACQFHTQKTHEHASEFEQPGGICPCPPSNAGKNLFVVCGPEGFISHYAGEKVWLGGRETQGPVGGMAARLQRQYPSLARDWLVLKL